MSHSVRIRSTGHHFKARSGERILDAALRQGIAMPYGCRNGACGSCKGRVLGGEIEYPDGTPGGLLEEEHEQGFALFCQAEARSDLEIDVPEVSSTTEIQVRTLPCRVVRKVQLAHDVMGLYLKLPDTERLQFLAGQYIDILLRDGRRRAFSLANAPHRDEFLELHVRHFPGGEFSDYVFSQMQEKALLRIRGPLGAFYLREDGSRPAVLLAGGTGFAPIKGMVEHALAEGTRRPMHLYWGVRARRDLYMHELARSWADAHPNLAYTPVLSEPDEADEWRGRTGFVHEAVLEDFEDLGGFDIYSSGPPAMVNAARQAFLARGLAPEHLYSDAFEFAYETGHNG